MNIMLNGTNIQVQNTNYNGTVSFQSKDAVQDEVRGYLMYMNNWCFVGVQQYKFLKQQKPLNKLALILESPHKDEYSANFVPLRPANGRTGTRLNREIVNRSFIGKLAQNIDYEVYLMNSIQYQCSCYHHLKNNNQQQYITSCLTKKVFRALFHKTNGNLRQDFINRLQSYAPDFIVNACTSGLKDGVVKTAIKQVLPNVVCVCDIHPSAWKQ